jgi:hypothetical protein
MHGNLHRIFSGERVRRTINSYNRFVERRSAMFHLPEDQGMRRPFGKARPTSFGDKYFITDGESFGAGDSENGNTTYAGRRRYGAYRVVCIHEFFFEHYK